MAAPMLTVAVRPEAVGGFGPMGDAGLPNGPLVVKVRAGNYVPSVRVMVNGEPRELPDSLSVAELVVQLGLQERRIAVEVNREILARERYATCRLAAGDEVEIVHFVGGG